jgi:hypothetical protein
MSKEISLVFVQIEDITEHKLTDEDWWHWIKRVFERVRKMVLTPLAVDRSREPYFPPDRVTLLFYIMTSEKGGDRFCQIWETLENVESAASIEENCSASGASVQSVIVVGMKNGIYVSTAQPISALRLGTSHRG